MKGRLKDLAKQAGIWFEDSKDIRTHAINTTTLERFAESIIRECAGIAERPHEYIRTESGQQILKHFGIEE